MASFEQLQQLVAEFFQINISFVSEETTADHIKDWDSFTHMELMTEIEKQFKLQIPLNTMMEFKNLGDIAEFIDTNASR